MNKRGYIRAARIIFWLVLCALHSIPAHAAPGSGSAAVLPATAVAAGSTGTWDFIYTAADTFISGTIEIAIPDGWSAPQISDPSAGGFVAVSSDGTLEPTPLTINGRSIVVHIAALDTSETVTVVYGDVSGDPGGAAAAQTNAESGVVFQVRSDPEGSGRMPVLASPTLDVTAASAAEIVFTTAPQSFPADGESGAIRLETRDAFGNPAPVESNIDLFLSSSAPGGLFSRLGGGAFSATDTVTMTTGTDTLSFYYRDTVAGAKTITVSAVGQGWTAPQQAITVEPGEPVELAVTPADTTATAGDYVRYRLRVEDEYGNASPVGSGQTIELIASAGSFYATSDHGTVITQVTIAAGSYAASVDYRHTVMDLQYPPYQLTFIDGDGAPPSLGFDLATIYIDHGPFDPVTSDVGSTDPYAIADNVDSVQLSAFIRDAFFNGIDGAVVLFESTGSGNTITQPMGGTAANGRANGSMRSTVAGTDTVTAHVGGVYVDHEVVVTFSVGPFDPAVSDIAVDKETATANGVDSIVVTVTVTDAQENPISGSVVTLECTGSGNTIRQPASVTDALGHAVGSVRSTYAEGKSIRARANGVYLNEIVPVTFEAGPFDSAVSDITVDKQTETANGIDSIVVTVTVRDAQGNPISGSVVTLECTGSGNTIGQPIGPTDASGQATGSVKSTYAEAKNIRARAGGVYLNEVVPVSFTAGPFDPAVSDVAVDKATATANGVDSIVVTVTVTDGQGNPISGSYVTVECTGSGNAIRQPAGLTDALGQAVGSVRSSHAEAKNIRARANGVYLNEIVPVSFAAGPFDTNVSGLQIDKTTATANGVDSVLVTITARDAQGNPVSGKDVTIECSGSGNVVQQPVGQTDSFGRAVGNVKSTVAEGKTIGALIDAVPITASAAVSFVPGPFDPDSSEIQVDKFSATADDVDAVIVTVYVRDANANPLAGKVVTIACTGTENTVSQPIGVTDAAGRAVGSVRSTVAQIKDISARADGFDISGVITVAFTAGPLHHFEITHGGSTTAGIAASVTLDARDFYNNKLTSFAGAVKVYPIRASTADYAEWGLGNAAGSIVSEIQDTVTYQFVSIDGGDAELLITDRKVESVAIGTSSGSVVSASASQLSVGPAAADSIFVVSGDGQRAVVDTEVPQPLIVGVEDAYGNRVPGVTVSFAATGGGGSIDASKTLPGVQTTAVTGSQGTAACESWRLGTAAGFNTNEVEATIASGTTRTATFTATTDHGPIASILLTPASKSVTVGTAEIVTATLRDAFNNLVFGEYVTMYIKDAPDGSLSAAAGSTTEELSPWMRRGMSDSTGTVSVTYNAPSAAGAQDVIDAYHTLVPAGSVADVVYTSVSSGATDLRATVTSGATSQAGVTFSFIVEAVDGNGNRDPMNTSHIVLEPPPGGGFVFSLTDFGAPVTEADLSAGAVTIYGRGSSVGTWSITARDAAALLGPDQFSVQITPNDAVAAYAVNALPTATAGADFQVEVEARDQFGNRVTTANYAIAFRAVQAADSSLAASGALSITGGTLTNGRYVGTNFKYQIAEPIRIEVSSGSNPVLGWSGAVAVDNAAAYRLAKIGGDSTGVAVGDSLRLRVRVFDIYGNNVDGQTVFFTVQEGGGGLPPQAVTDGAGAASVWFVTDTIRGTNRARATILDAKPEGLETQSFEVTTLPLPEIDYAVLSLPGTSFQAGELFTGNVAVYDRYGNLIDTDSSTQLRPIAERASIDFTPDIATLAAGRTSFTAVDSIAGTNRIAVRSLTGDTLAPPSAPLTIRPAPAYRIVGIRGDTSGVTVGATVELRARVFDRYYNAIASEIVRFRITSSLGGTPMLWDATADPNDGIVQTGAGGTAVCFLQTDLNAGLNTVTASIFDASPPALEQVTFSVGTIAGNIARFDVIPDGLSRKAGESFTADIIAYDTNGNVAVDDDTTRVDLGSNGAAVFAVNPVTLSAGRATASVRDTVAQRLVLRARTLAGGATSYSDTIVVSPEVPSGLIAVSVSPDTITANGASRSTLTTQPVRDVYGNVVTPGTLIRVTPSLGTVASDDQDLSTPEFERLTQADGVVSVFIQSSQSPGTSDVDFLSLTGSAAGSASVVFAPAPVCLYANYMTPRHLVPTLAAQFRVAFLNPSPTGAYLTTATAISFADSAGHEYKAYLPAPRFMRGSAPDTLQFASAVVPEGMLGGTYTPRITLVGTDIYDSPYYAEFNAGSNSISISHIEIVRVTSEKSVVSRGDTFAVFVQLHNGGGSTVRVNDIGVRCTHNRFELLGSWNPPLPDSLASGNDRTYSHTIRLFSDAPLGIDTIDASATAQADGTMAQDLSAYPNAAVITIQSAASISYAAGTLNPDTVSRGQTHAFELSLRNNGQAAVILDAVDTRLSFTDGVDTVRISLGYEGALPGYRTTILDFPAVLVPSAMDAGSWPVTVRLHGTENGGHLDTTIVLSDPITVVNPAALSYRSGTLAPVIVSKRSTVSFEAGIDNAGGASVVCNPDSTRITFTDGALIYTALLDATRGRVIGPGESTLYFRTVEIPAGFAVGSYQPSVRITGTENGIRFVSNHAVSDAVGVQEPSQLAITSTTVLPSSFITANQTPPWFARIQVRNNGGATVRLDSLALRLLAGPVEVTGQYVLTPIDFQPHVDSLLGGAADTLTVRFEDNASDTMTTGTIVIESRLWGRDLNSGATLLATTEFGGKGSFLVQSPANLVFTAVLPSVDTVTALQTKNWVCDVTVRNTGQSDIQLDLTPANTFLTFSTSGDFLVIAPTSLRGGGTVLEGGSTDTLRWTIDRSGSAAGSCTIEAAVRGTEINSGRIITAASGAQGVRGSVLVQTPAALEIVRMTPSQDPVTIQQPRPWSIVMEIRNTGQSDAAIQLARTDSTRVAIYSGSGFIIDNPVSLAGGGAVLHGGATGLLTFTVSTTGVATPGEQVITGSVLAIESNSDRHVYAARTATASTDSVRFEQRPDPEYVTGTLQPTVASGGTSASFEARIVADAGLHATLVLDRDETILSFGDADGDTFRTSLSDVSGNILPRASQLTLLFDAGIVETAIALGKHPVFLRLIGEENGNPFSAVLPLDPDSVTIERAPQLSISRIVTPQSVTRSQTVPWIARMLLRNNGEASVDLDLASAKTFLTFTIVGAGDRTYEYTVQHPAALAGRGGTVLPGGAADSLVFTVTGTGSTTGIALVNGTVAGIDVNSSLAVGDDTYSGGYSHMAVELPGAPAVAATTPSRPTVTSAQTAAWQITCEVCNTGEADLTLLPGNARVYYDNDQTLPHAKPSAFVEGGLALPGGACKHLLFTVSPTPTIPSGADIALHAQAVLSENNNGITRSYDTRTGGFGSGTIRVQAPARLGVTRASVGSPREPFVNVGQQFPLRIEITNTGEAAAENLRVALERSGSSTIADTLIVIGGIGGSAAAADSFSVTAAGAGDETFTARIRSATDANSGQGDLVTFIPSVDDTAHAWIQQPAALAVTAVVPSQAAVNAGQTVEWTLKVKVRNDGVAPLEIAAPASGDIAFTLGGVPLGGYLVIAPTTFASGGSPLVLPGGSADSLIYRIATTGRDTGTVDIAATLGWIDRNQPAAPQSAAAGSGSVRVQPPSGLRIIAVSSDAPNNAQFPNTSVVNTGQSFSLTVTVENTGGDDLDSVIVRCASNSVSGTLVAGDSMFYMPAKSERDFVYSITAGSTPAVEYLRASIVKAVSVNTGERVTPAEAVESIENLRIELPASLVCAAGITSPPGAVDDTLSTSQSFVVTAAVANFGQAVIDDSGELTLELPVSMSLQNPGSDPLVKPFAAGAPLSWSIVAPASARTDEIRIFISSIPNDINSAAPAALGAADARITVVTEPAGTISGLSVAFAEPPGAADGVLSSGQSFTVRTTVTASMNADSVWGEIAAPAGFLVPDAQQLLGRGTGTADTLRWYATAADIPMTDTIFCRVRGKDINSGAAIGPYRVAATASVVRRAALSLGARISGPEEALDGVVSVNLPFTVEATVTNSGTAGVDTAGARIELVLPAGQGYGLDGAQETYRKSFHPGDTVRWRLVAPGSPTSPANLQFRFAEPYARDENTNLACAISGGEAFVPVQTEAGAVRMSNISALDTIPPYVVPQGATAVPVLRSVFRNTSGYPVGLDTMYVSIKDGRGRLVSNPSRRVAAVVLIGDGGRFEAVVSDANPVPVIVGHAFVIDPDIGGTGEVADTLLMAVDIAGSAAPGELRFEIERSAHVVCSISLPGGGVGPRVGVVDDEGEDIAGSFLSGPLSVMSARFEEYVHNYPNPFRAGAQRTNICYFLTRDASVTIRIYDLAGSLVWTKEIGAGEPGGTGTAEGTWHEVPWDGRNARGELVRNGVYICKVEAGSQSALFKIAVAK